MQRARLFPLSIALFISLCSIATAQQWSGLLSSKRAVDWSNSGAGTIPSRSNICQTLGAAGQSASYSQSVSAAQIVSALQSCAGSNGVVYLNPGTYTLTSTLFGAGVATPSNVTLRGAGANQTILKWTATSNNCTGLGPTAFCLTNGDAGTIQYSSNAVNWTGGYSQGSTSLTVGGAVTGSLSNLKVGSLVQLNQLDQSSDNGNWWNCGAKPTSSNPGTGCTWGGNSNMWPGRAQTQMVTVTGISGSTVTISPGLYAPNWSGSQSPYMAFSSVLPVSGFGLESLQLNTQSLGDIQAMLASVWITNSWIKNVAFVNNDATGAAARKHAEIMSSTHVTIRDSYFYGASPTSDGYGVDLMDGTSDTLVENNIFQHIATGTILEGGIGNVFGYNYAVDNFYVNGDPNWQQCDAFHHNEGDIYDLWEGHEGICLGNDDFHGTSFGITAFRSYFSGHDPAITCPPGESSCGTGKKLQFTAAIMDMFGARYMNLVGNVLGTPGYHNTYENIGPSGQSSCAAYPWTVIYSWNFSNQNQLAWLPSSSCMWDTSVLTVPLDNDPLVYQTAFRWGNYDTVSGTVKTVSSETNANAPAYPGLSNPSTNWSSYPSFYLSSKPSWWGSMPWPAVGPDVTGGDIAGLSGHAYHNPAASCYLNIMGGKTDGSSGALSFDANSCYPTTASSAGGPPPPPTNLSGTVQ